MSAPRLGMPGTARHLAHLPSAYSGWYPSALIEWPNSEKLWPCPRLSRCSYLAPG